MTNEEANQIAARVRKLDTEQKEQFIEKMLGFAQALNGFADEDTGDHMLRKMNRIADEEEKGLMFPEYPGRNEKVLF